MPALPTGAAVPLLLLMVLIDALDVRVCLVVGWCSASRGSAEQCDLLSGLSDCKTDPPTVAMLDCTSKDLACIGCSICNCMCRLTFADCLALCANCAGNPAACASSAPSPAGCCSSLQTAGIAFASLTSSSNTGGIKQPLSHRAAGLCCSSGCRDPFMKALYMKCLPVVTEVLLTAVFSLHRLQGVTGAPGCASIPPHSACCTRSPQAASGDLLLMCLFIATGILLARMSLLLPAGAPAAGDRGDCPLLPNAAEVYIPQMLGAGGWLYCWCSYSCLTGRSSC